MTYENFVKSVIERDINITRSYLNKLTFKLAICFLCITFDIMYLSLCVLPFISAPIIGVCFLFLFIFFYDYMAQDSKAFNLGRKMSKLWYIVVILSVIIWLVIRLFLGK